MRSLAREGDEVQEDSRTDYHQDSAARKRAWSGGNESIKALSGVLVQDVHVFKLRELGS